MSRHDAIDCGGCAPAVYVKTERQQDQAEHERMVAESRAAADKACPDRRESVIAELVNAGNVLATFGTSPGALNRWHNAVVAAGYLPQDGFAETYA